MSQRAKQLLTLMRGGAFSPSQVSSLAAWYDMITPALLFQNSNGTTAVSANADPVGYVTDRSGNGRHLLQSTSGSRLAYVTGGGIQSDGTDDFMVTATMSSPITFTAQTVFLVFKYNASINNERGFSQSASTTADYSLAGHYVPITRSGTTSSWGAYATSGFRSTVTVNASTKTLFTATHSGTSIVNRVNGAAGSGYSHTLNLVIDKFGIGRPVNDTVPNSAVTIYELLIYSKLVTGSELTAIESYLTARHSIS